MIRNFSAFYRQFLGGLVENGFNVSIGLVWTETVFSKKIQCFLLSGHWEKNYHRNFWSQHFFLRYFSPTVANIERNVLSFFSTNFWRCCQNCFLRVLRKVLRTFSVLEKTMTFIHQFRILSKNISALCRKKSTWVFTTPFYVSMTKTWRKIVFFDQIDNFSIFSGHCAIFLGVFLKQLASCRNCILCGHRNVWKKLFSENFFSNHFLTMSRKLFWLFFETNSAYLSKLHFTVHQKNWRIFFSERNFLPDRFRTSTITILAFCRKITGVFDKIAFFCVHKIILRIIFFSRKISLNLSGP